MDPTWVDIANKISGVSFASAVVIVLIAGYFQKWVWGWQLQAAEKRADFWQNLYLTRVVPLEKTVEKISGGTA